MVGFFLFVFVTGAIGIGLAPFITPYLSFPLGALAGLYVAFKAEK